MTECHVLDPALFALLDPLRPTLRALRCLRRQGRLLVNLLPTGADLLLDTDADPDAADRATLAAFAARHHVTRIAWRRSPGQAPETLVQLAPSRIAFAGRAVDVPPGAFLQAAPDTERAIVDAVLQAVPARPARPRIVELYAGLGTLTLPLATRARVRAYEGDAQAASALARATAGLPVDVQRRDLARDPVTAKDIGDADAVVLDPPYAGAGRQLAHIAASAARTVILVSCNPAALRREAATLRGAGFGLTGAIAIDQFLFSPRIESVSVFSREKKARGAAL